MAENKGTTANSSQGFNLEKQNKDLKKKYDELKKQYNDNLKRYNDTLNSIASLRHELSNKSTEINKLKSDTSSLNKELTEMKTTLKKTNKMLLNNALNFLYIPYEAWSIDSVAIPAFNAISDLTLKKEYQKEEKLLKNYYKDASELVKFLSKVENGKDGVLLQMAMNTKKFPEELKKLDLYKRYTEKEKFYKSYYLGRKIKAIERELENSNPNITSIKNELVQCLETK